MGRPLVRMMIGFGIIGMAASAWAQPLVFQPVTMNRWMYPFDSLPGNRPEASTFGAILISGFDDRDAQFLLGVDTFGSVPTGLALESYDVASVRVSLWISQGDRFEYDPTPDPIESWYAVGTPGAVPDPDVGRPIEVFGAGYRAGFTATGATAFQQTSPFASLPPIVPPAEGNRNVFAADYDVAGNATDVSRQVRLQQSASAWAIGVTSTVSPGSLVPTGTRFDFELDLSRPEVRAYVQRGLRDGRLNLVVTSLHPSSGGPGQPIGTNFPVFATKENAAAVASGQTPRIEITVGIVGACYANCDGSTGSPALTPADFVCFLNKFRAGDAYANCDGSTGTPTLTPADFVCFLNKFRAGCG